MQFRAIHVRECSSKLSLRSRFVSIYLIKQFYCLWCGLTFALTGPWWCDGIWPRIKWRAKCRHAAMGPVERMVRRQFNFNMKVVRFKGAEIRIFYAGLQFLRTVSNSFSRTIFPSFVFLSIVTVYLPPCVDQVSSLSVIVQGSPLQRFVSRSSAYLKSSGICPRRGCQNSHEC